MNKKIVTIVLILGILLTSLPFIVAFLVNNGYTKEESKIEVQKDFSSEKKDIDKKIDSLITK